ncbi:MAG: NYN domain-containing protein [Phycisphaerae bacterium]|nr:NYN domain-containing protein [Phycisphaerae bacterium]
MPLVVDAYNVLHVTGVLPPDLAGIDLDGLADLIETTRFAREETWVVCDGMRHRESAHSGPRRRERVWFSWAGPGNKADDLIIGLVRRSSSPRRMTVVTSDRGIVKEVRRRGAETWTSEEFLERIVADRRHAKRVHPKQEASLRASLPLAAPEVRAWLKLFGIAADVSEGSEKTGVSIASSSTGAPEAPGPRPTVPRPPTLRPTSTRVETVETVETAETAETAESSESSASGSIDDPLFIAGLDLMRLLEGTPPPRDDSRSPRRSRRERRR